MHLGQRAVQTAAISALFAALGTLFCGLRLWTRAVVIRAVGYEDLILLASWVCSIATVICTGAQLHYGLGEHAKVLSNHQLERLTFYVYLSITTYCASIGLTKIAILLQYQRVFPARKFQVWCWSFIAIVAAFTIATVLTSIFACSPIEKFWTFGEGTCINSTASWFSNAAINIVTDLMIIILPMPVVKNLKLAKRQKWLLMGVFAFGGVVCIISVVRLHSLLVMATTTDPSFDNAPIATFSTIEVNVALMSACLPTLKPLIAPWVKGLTYTSRGTHGSTSASHRQKQSSGMPTIGGYSIGMNSLSTKRGVERLDEESDHDDKIRVVTRVDIKVHEKGAGTLDGSAKSSTESLFRNHGVGNIV